MFYARDVLYVSTHQQGLWPYTGDVPAGAGVGGQGWMHGRGSCQPGYTHHRLLLSHAVECPPTPPVTAGKVTQTGSGPGQGSTINLPLPGGSGDAAMRLAWAAVVEPAVRRFQPDVLLVSAGACLLLVAEGRGGGCRSMCDACGGAVR